MLACIALTTAVAALAPPGLESSLEARNCDHERHDRVEPPDPGESVSEQPDEEPDRERGAEKVLLALGAGRGRADARTDPALGEPEPAGDDADDDRRRAIDAEPGEARPREESRPAGKREPLV